MTSHISSDRIIDRSRGVLLGQLIGDSLGSLVEFQTAFEITKVYPAGVRDLAAGGPFNLDAGQPTDDSEMALTLARSLRAVGDYDPLEVHESYVEWALSEPFDIGQTTFSALRRDELSMESQANGALMRVSPIAIAFAGDPLGASRAALLDAAMTHPNTICLEINALFAGVLSEAITSEWDAARTFAEFENRATPDLAELISVAKEVPPTDFMTHQGWVKIAFHNALFELANGESFEESLVRTVGRGGDTDTNAAIAGALLGGIYGLSAMNREWVGTVLSCRPDADSRRPRPEQYWPGDAIELADSLLALEKPNF
ncbi:ADP-ribosylglycohydrolase family protein [Corynebacterium callunae]|uniref:ADP-ribosylglycohydrolase family protein n=1 Tax=Corynebacterium callunae TaxID=1721 RepID=UPI0039827F1E